MTHKNIHEKILSHAEKKSIQFFDGFISSVVESASGAKDGMPFEVSASERSSLILRVWNKNGEVGVVQTSNLSEEGLITALEMAEHISVYDQVKCVYNSFYKNQKFNSAKQEAQKLVPIKSLSKAAIECEKFLLSSLKSIKSVPYNKVSQKFSFRAYFNSEGIFREDSFNSTGCYFYPLAEQEGKIPRQMGEYAFANDFQLLEPMLCAEQALIKLKSHLNYGKIQSGKYKVLFSPESFLNIFESFTNFFNAQNILDQKSLSKMEDLGKKISIDALNIVDDPIHYSNKFQTTFDQEGNAHIENSIINQGVFNSLMHSSHTAKIFNSLPTGNSSLGSKLTLSPNYLHVYGTNTEKFNELPKEDYIYIENVKALHAGVNQLQGSFSLPFDGFLISQGEKQSVESATVAGDFFALLKQIFFMGDKLKSLPSGYCPEVGVEDLFVTSK